MRVAFFIDPETGWTSWHVQGSVYTPKVPFRPKVRPRCALRVWYRSCSELWRRCFGKPGQGKFFMCLSGEKSEECHAEKTCSSMCR